MKLLHAIGFIIRRKRAKKDYYEKHGIIANLPAALQPKRVSDMEKNGV